MKRMLLKFLCASIIFVAVAAQATAAPVKVTIWTTPMGVGQEGMTKLVYSSTSIGKLVSAMTGVDWEYSVTTTTDWAEALNLRLASDDFTDAITWNGDYSQLNKLIAAGVIVPLDSYYKNPKYPAINALNTLRPEVIKYWTYTDGHIYNYPNAVYQDAKQAFGYWAASNWIVRPDYLTTTGMKVADLKTIAGVEKFLRAVKAKNLKTADGKPVYGISSAENLSIIPVVLSSFGVSSVGQGFELVKNKMVHIRDNPQTKAALQWLNTLWVDGLMDPESFSQKNETLREKMLGKRIAMMATVAWPYWQTVTMGKTAVTENLILEFPLAPGVAKDGVTTTYNPNGAGGLLLTKNASTAAKDAVASLVNEFWKDMDPKGDPEKQWEHSLILGFGEKGKLWDWDPRAGAPYYSFLNELKEATSSGDYNKLQPVGFQMNPLHLMGRDGNYFTYDSREPLDWIFKMHKFGYNKPHVAVDRPYDNLKTPADGLWNTNVEILGRVDQEFWAKLMTGPKASFEATWKTYQAQLEAQGSWSKVKAEWEATYKALVN